MKSIILILVLVAFLTGCVINARLFTPQPERGRCNATGNSFDLGRIDFNILLSQNWKYVWHKEDEIISFHFLDDGLSSAINVTSYTNKFDHYDLQWDDIKSIEAQYQGYAKSSRKGSADYNPVINVDIVKIGVFECVRYYEKIMAPTPSLVYRTAFSGGYTESVSFTCVVPSQPDILPIRTGMGQSVGPNKESFDIENILIHVIENIVLNPNPPDNPNAIPKRDYPPWDQWGTEETMK